MNAFADARSRASAAVFKDDDLDDGLIFVLCFSFLCCRFETDMCSLCVLIDCERK